jgi:predicted enzyme related to lactoylglutathione lyase
MICRSASNSCRWRGTGEPASTRIWGMTVLAGVFKMALFNLTLNVNTRVIARVGVLGGSRKMFSNGNATIYISDMDRSVNFYTKILGLKLAQRFGNHWASVEAGKLTIGLHPASDHNPAGRNGSTIIGLELTGGIEDAVGALKQQGVKIRGAVSQDNAGKFALFEDPDGNLLYMIQLKQWAGQESSGHAYQTT